MSEAPSQQDAPGSQHDDAHRKRRRRRRLHWHLSIWMLVWLGLGAAFIVLASMSLTGRVVALPDAVARAVETRLNERIPGGGLSLGRVEFGVSPRGFPRLQLVDLALRDQTGLEIGRLYRLSGGIQPKALLHGELAPGKISLSGAEVTIRRRADGEFDLSFGQKGAASGNLASVLDAIDGLFAAGPLSRAEEITADQLTITLEDARSGRLWQVTEGELKLTQTERIVDITVNFAVFNQTEELAETSLGFRTAKDSSEAQIGATFRNAAARDIAAQSPVLAFLGVLDAPISGALRSTIQADGSIGELAGTLSLGPGALSPSPGARPVRFDEAKLYVDYEPEGDRLDLVDLYVRSELGEVQGSAQIYLRDYNRGWPTMFLAQANVARATFSPGALFPEPLALGEGRADLRLRLNPFTLEIGQLVTSHDGAVFHASGEIAATSSGWRLALDAWSDASIARAQGLALWPLAVAAKTRNWVERNVEAVDIVAPRFALRQEPGEKPYMWLQSGFENARVRVFREMAPITGARGYMVLDGTRFTAVSEGGEIVAPQGGALAVAGTVFSISNTRQKPADAITDLHVSGPASAALSLLDGAPFRVLRNTDFGPDLATGQVKAHGRLAFSTRRGLGPEDVRFSLDAALSGLSSRVLVPGKTITMEQARLTASNDRIEISGAARIGQARAEGTWSAPIGKAASQVSHLAGTLVLDRGFAREFSIGLPDDALSGETRGRFEMDLTRGEAPRFTLASDLAGLGVAISDLGWRKPAAQTGSLRLEGALGDSPVLDLIAFEAPGLKARGHLTTAPDGTLGEAVFERVQLGGWLDAGVRFTGRGPGRAVAISIEGGSLDMRKATFTGKPGTSGAGEGDAPIALSLDRMTISQGIALTSMHGTLERQGGLSGTFAARVNGEVPVSGVVAPLPDGSAVRLTSADAGAVMRVAGVFKTARGGNLQLTLAPLGHGEYEGDLGVTDTRVVGASSLAELLSALSVVGLLEQLSAEGIAFNEVSARFRLTPDRVVITEGSAVGASLGVSLDGIYTLGSGTMNFAGVISPIYVLNAVGEVFTRKGEGLIGFTYEMTGTSDDPKVSVNPLSILTPAMFREIFRRPPPKLRE